MKEFGTRKAAPGAGRVIIDFLEYVLMFTVIIECNSLFHYSENYRQTTLEVVVTIIAILIAAILAWYYGCRLKNWLWEDLHRSWPVWLALGAAVFLFLGVNVLRIGADSALRKYTLSFVLFLPVCCCLFRAYRSTGKQNTLFFKYSDLTIAVAIVNLIIFAVVTIRPDIIHTFQMKTRWSGLGYLKSIYNYLNCFCVAPSVTRTLFGYTIYRNSAFFTEPLMYCIPLITSLFTEMFLRRKEERRVWKWALLIMAIFTSQSTLGMLLASGAVGIKLIEGVHLKRRWIMVFPALLIVVLAAVVFLRQKMSLGGESTASHIWHYIAAGKTFLERPLIGCGYFREDLIRLHMTPEQMERTAGLSNSVAVVLAEGGVLLGLMCMTPFFIGLAGIRRENTRRIALWTLGPLGLYCVTVFHFHLLLMMIMAFGYSMLELTPTGGGRRRLVLAEEGEAPTPRRPSAPELGARAAVLLLGACAAAALLLSEDVWLSLSRWLQARQLYLGQSSWKVYFFSLFLILAVLVFRSAVRGIGDKQERSWAAETVWFACFTALFAFAYSPAFSLAATLLDCTTPFGDLFETGALALVYFGGVALGWLLIALLRRNKRLFVVGIGGTVILAALAAAACFLLVSRTAVPTAGVELALRDAAAAAEGRIYANEKPAALKRSIPELAWSPARDGAFAAMENASVVTAHDRNLTDLIEAGFVVTELSPEYLLYSNDDAVIGRLREDGYDFRQYYSFPIPADHPSTAVLTLGSYTLTAELQRTPEQSAPHEPVCMVEITSYYDTEQVAGRTVYADEFDAEGRCTVSLSFFSGEWEGMGYSVLSDGETGLQVESLVLRETPEYLTERVYNGRHQVIREAYFDLSGQPYRISQGYAGLSREYDRAGRIVRQTYLNEEGLPVVARDGYASFERSFDRLGKLERESYFDAEGDSCRNRSGYAAVVNDYDARGNLCLVRYLDERGEAAVTAFGYAELRRTYDANRRVVSEEYFGPGGEPAVLENGASSVRFEYDAQGREIARHYYDRNGREILGE